MDGLVIRSLGGFYNVACGHEVYECKPRGLFRKEHTVIVVGDRVDVSLQEDGSGVIETLYPRKNLFARPPVANLDVMFIVLAAALPAPDMFFADKLTVICLRCGVKPVIVLNKADLDDTGALAGIYARTGIDVAVTNALTGDGVGALTDFVGGGICAFAGFSGVGKSSIISELLPLAAPVTGAVSERLGRGRHTTRHVELYPLSDGGWIADTPGFSSLDFSEQVHVGKDELPALFPEFEPYLGSCRFTTCSHRTEKGCAVLAGVADGTIPLSRHQSYLRLYEQVKDLHDWDDK